MSPAKITAPDRDRKYQQNAISEIIKKFKVHDRGQLIMACGTGKNFVTYPAFSIFQKSKSGKKTFTVFCFHVETAQAYCFVDASKAKLKVGALNHNQNLGLKVPLSHQ